jgi:copper chaperone CopZ
MTLSLRSAFGLSVVAAAILLTGCAAGGGRTPGEPEGVTHQTTQADIDMVKSTKPVQGEHAVLFINGMGCPQCVTNIDIQLAKLPGVSNPKVDLAKGTVSIDLAPAMKLPSPHRFAEAAADAGLTLAKIEVHGSK